MIFRSAVAGQRFAFLFTVIVGVIVFDDIVLLAEESDHGCIATDISETQIRFPSIKLNIILHLHITTESEIKSCLSKKTLNCVLQEL